MRKVDVERAPQRLQPRQRRQLALLIAATFAAFFGIGVVLPYLYAFISQTRGFGRTTAAVFFVLMSMASLVATLAAGRWSDRGHSRPLAIGARAVAAAATLGVGWAGTPLLVCLAGLASGAASSAAIPPTEHLLLHAAPEGRRREIIAAEFVAINLSLAAGSAVSGFVVDLSHPSGVWPVFVMSAVAEVVSIAILLPVATAPRAPDPDRLSRPAPRSSGYRDLLRHPGMALLLTLTLLLMFAFYGQYESGLPAYVLTSLHVAPHTLGLAVAVNALLVAALLVPVSSVSRTRSAGSLLAGCAALWTLSWGILALPLGGLPAGGAATLVVAAYAVIAVGETVLSPVITPAAVALVPDTESGTAIGAVNACRTVATTVGPALSAGLLSVGAWAFVALQIACCLGALAAAIAVARRGPVHHRDSTVRRAPPRTGS